MGRPLAVWLTLAVLVALMAWPHQGVAAERVYIDITQPNFVRLPIAVPDLQEADSSTQGLGTLLASVVANDLDLSGLFRVLDPKGFLGPEAAPGVTAAEIRFDRWRRGGAEFLVRGRCARSSTGLRTEFRLYDVVAQRLVVGKIYEGRREDARIMAHRFANEILAALTGEAGMFDTQIAFVQAKDGSKEIFLMDIDGENLKRVTGDGSTALSPAWSPDGRQLAYVSYFEGTPRLYAVDLFSGTRRTLCAYAGLNISPAWRPDGEALAVTLSKDGNPDIYLVDRNGRVLQRLAASWAIDVSPSWSPDGTRLAYVSAETGNPQIYVLDVATGKKERLTYHGKYNTAPSWSPKGDWIAYSGMDKGRNNIYIIRPDGSEIRQLTHGEGDNEAPTWSPDGRMIAFSSTRQGGRSAVWVMLYNGEGVKRLTRLPGEQTLPDWSPRIRR
ncbi:TolB protein [Desulfacinum hydrothermale DSM 13146]|uniref:TolB protein n=1 Tax=Desulfacinum hydrothermale DSM 13146 TaxID=1121390 RepID=A0A1W1X287_9BACT|nr:Tol-Pal system beta propeller repeat protein TolB [Desulfacinum hydrothermale]SMC18089.1 TolB protein [Desulfacinum hydrothermale DSM 13146]